MAKPFSLSLYLVTDRRLAGSRGVFETVRVALAGGVTLVQLRDPEAPTRGLVEEARALKALLAPHGIPLIINDRVDVALASGADGVHLGQDDMDARDARRLLGSDAIIGLSVGSPAELEASAEALAAVDYLGTGPVRATATKAGAGDAIGPAGVAAVVARTTLPVVAIGGIGAAHAAAAIEAGAQGIAVVSAIMAEPDPERAARELRAIIADATKAAGR